MITQQPVYDFMTLDDPAGEVYYGNDAIPVVKPAVMPRTSIRPGKGVRVTGYPDAPMRRDTTVPGDTGGTTVAVAQPQPSLLDTVMSNPILLIGGGLVVYMLLKGK